MNFFHITDVWSSYWNWTDSTMRILKQYQKLWVSANVVSAWHSPLHVAFTASTDLIFSAWRKTEKTLNLLWIKNLKKNVFALNCAPRNNKNILEDWKEDNIFKISLKDWNVFVLYWFDVLRWIIEFYWKDNLKIERINSVNWIIEDTSKWSQFRSWEFLPIVHFLESQWALEKNSELEEIFFDDFEEIFKNKESEIVILPPDEYKNCRILVSEKLSEKILKNSLVEIENLFEWKIKVQNSLTKVVPWEISLWPSSNHFFNEKIKVLNLWTRWSEWQTKTTDEKIFKLSEKIEKNIGKNFKILF